MVAKGVAGQDVESMTYTAHRGFADRYPQNTLAAINGAAADGADTIEFDVRPCADGELVVFHDDYLDSKTDLEGAVEETPVEKVLTAKVLDSDSTIPRFADVIEAVSPSVNAIVELKSPGQEDWPVVARRALGTIADTTSRQTGSGVTYISSFHEGALAAVSKIEPDRPLVVLPGGDLQGGIEIATKYDAAAISVRKDHVDSSLVSKLHDQDRLVAAYTVETREMVRDLKAYGVDWVTCDTPRILPKEISVLPDGDPATDTNGDGRYDDVDGDGDTDVVDVQALFANRDDDAIQDNTQQFDFNDDGTLDVVDAQALFAKNT